MITRRSWIVTESRRKSEVPGDLKDARETKKKIAPLPYVFVVERTEACLIGCIRYRNSLDIQVALARDAFPGLSISTYLHS